MAGLSVAGTTAAVVLTTPTSFGEIATVDVTGGAATVVTSHGADDVELFTREEREFTVSDGTVVHGWLLRDPARTGPLPLLLDIHGGPHNAWNGGADAVHLYHQQLAARGWAVLLLNPRGSDGYGEAFYTAAVGAWGVADAKDFLEPLDQLVAEGVADARRLAVAGYSYGGYMTCYLTSRDDRFAAAVAGGVVSDAVSMAGTSDSGHYLGVVELGGRPGGEPRALRRAFPAGAGGKGAHADAGRARRRRRPVPGRAGRAVVQRAARTGRADPAGALPGRVAPVHPRRPPVAPRGLQPPHRRLGRAVRGRAGQAGAAADRRRPLAPPPRRARAQAPRPRCGAGHPAARRRRGRPGEPRRAEQGDRRRGHRRLGVPDRLDHQGVDGDRRDAAGRRRTAEAGRADHRRPARAAAGRPGRHQEGDAAAPADPHQRHRRRRVHRHRPRRRLPREVRRDPRPGRADPSARRDAVLLQLGVRPGRPGDREADREDVGRGPARAAVHPAGLEAHEHPAGGGAPAPRGDGARRGR